MVHYQIHAGNAYPQPNVLSNNTLITIYNNFGLPKLQLYLPYPLPPSFCFFEIACVPISILLAVEYCSGQVNWDGQLSASSVLSHQIAVLSVSAGWCPKVRNMSALYYYPGSIQTFSVLLQKTCYRLFRNIAQRSSTTILTYSS